MGIHIDYLLLVCSIEFDKCVKEMGYLNTPWDLKLFYKWINGKPLFVEELEKFKLHNCLLLMHFDGQHLVPMKWIFSINTEVLAGSWESI